MINYSETSVDTLYSILYILFSSEKSPLIFNYVSSKRNPLTLKEFFTSIKNDGLPYWPSIKSIWYYSFMPTSNPYLYSLLFLLLHTIPGYFLDFLARMTGRKPM